MTVESTIQFRTVASDDYRERPCIVIASPSAADKGKTASRRSDRLNNHCCRMARPHKATFRIAQHFVVPLFLGILQPEKDAPPPSVSDFLTLKTIQVSNQHTLTLYAEAVVTNSCSQSSTSQSLPSLSSNNLDSPLPVVNVITHPFVWTHSNMTIQASGTVSTLPQF